MFPRSSIADVFEIPFTLAMDEAPLKAPGLSRYTPTPSLNTFRTAPLPAAPPSEITLGDSVEFVGDRSLLRLHGAYKSHHRRLLPGHRSRRRGRLRLSRMSGQRRHITIKTREGEIPRIRHPWYTETDREFLTLGALLIKYTGRGGEVIIDFSVKYIPSMFFIGQSHQARDEPRRGSSEFISGTKI